MASPNQHRPAVERTLAAFEAFQQRMMNVHAPEFAALDITMAQAKLLYVITAGGPLTMSEISQRLSVTVSTASGAVDHLVAVGLLARVDDPANRRQVQVSVTALGQETLAHIRELNTRHLRALFDVISDADLEVLERATGIMSDAIALTSAAADAGLDAGAAPTAPGGPDVVATGAPDLEPPSPPVSQSGSHQ
jgi:DNA-binding MarR family transcriptional regulator